MGKFRILEKADLGGEICFIPQQRKFWFWLNFYEFEMFPKLVKFHSLECAIKFLDIQNKSPKIKIHKFQ